MRRSLADEQGAPWQDEDQLKSSDKFVADFLLSLPTRKLWPYFCLRTRQRVRSPHHCCSEQGSRTAMRPLSGRWWPADPSRQGGRRGHGRAVRGQGCGHRGRPCSGMFLSQGRQAGGSRGGLLRGRRAHPEAEWVGRARRWAGTKGFTRLDARHDCRPGARVSPTASACQVPPGFKQLSTHWKRLISQSHDMDLLQLLLVKNLIENIWFCFLHNCED